MSNVSFPAALPILSKLEPPLAKFNGILKICVTLPHNFAVFVATCTVPDDVLLRRILPLLNIPL